MNTWRPSGSPGGSGNRGQSWRQASTGPQDPSIQVTSKGKRFGKIIATILGSGMSLGLLVWCLTLIGGCDRAQLYVTVSPDRYLDIAIPPNDFADRDRLNILSLVNGRTIEGTDPAVPGNDFANQYRGVRRSNCAVHYFCLHGRADASGPFFYLPGVEIDRIGIDKDQRLWRLDDMWEALAKLPVNQRKLVLLDATRLDGHERMGFFENHFLDGIAKRVEQIPNLFVITSHADDETNWTSSEFGRDGLGGSVFGHFVVAGLEGDADAAPKNGRITVGELYDFVRTQVNRWVKMNRDLRGQHPLLFGQPGKLGDDGTFTIASVNPGWNRQKATPVASAVPAPEGDAKPAVTEAQVLDALSAAWQQRADLQTKPDQVPYRFDPLKWRSLTQQLLEAEHRLRNGERESAKTLAEVTRNEFAQLGKTATLTALIRRTGSSKDRFVESSLERQWGATGSAEAAPPREGLAMVDQTVQRLLTEVEPAVADAALRRRVFGLHQQLASGWSSGGSTGHPTIGSVPYVSRWLSDGDTARRAAFDALYVGDAKAAERLVDEAGRAYQKMVEISTAWHAAEQTLHRAEAQLPVLALWAARRTPSSKIGHELRKRVIKNVVNALDSNGSFDRSGVDVNVTESRPTDEEFDVLQIDLIELFEQTRALQSRLFAIVKTSTLDGDASGLEKLADRLAADLDRFHKQFNNVCDKVSTSIQPQSSAWLELNDLLRATEIEPTLRLDLLRRQLEFSRILFRKAAENVSTGRDQEEPPAVDSTRSLWQSLWAIQALMLGQNESTLVITLNGLWVKAWSGDGKSNPEKLRVLGDRVRVEWAERARLAKESLADGSEQKVRERYFRADQAARTVHWSDAIKLASGRDNPTQKLSELYLVDHLTREAASQLDDYWADWFDPAASEMLRAAKLFSVKVYEDRLKTLTDRLSELRQVQLRCKVAGVEFRIQQQVVLAVPLVGQNKLPAGELALMVQVSNPPKHPVGQAPVVRSEQPRYAVKTGLDQPDGGLSVKLLRDEDFDATKCEGKLTGQLQTYFRGHQAPDNFATFPVDPCIPKGTLYDFVPLTSREGESAIRVLGYDERPIVFILDCSGSMKEQINGGIRARFDEARDVLMDVTRKFADANASQPNKPPRRAAYWAFGHTERTQDDFPPERLPTWPKTLQTVPVLEVVDEQLVQRLQTVLPRTEELNPRANTMLIRSIETVYDELQKREQSAIIVVITDGADSYLNPPEGLPAAQTAKLKAAARDLIDRIQGHRELLNKRKIDVELHVVGFDVSPVDRSALAALLQPSSGGVQGKFYNAPNGDALGTTLRDASAPRQFAVVPLNVPNPLLSDSPQADLGKAVSNLKPGRYQVTFPKLMPFDINLRGGERLDLELLENRFRLALPPVLQPDVETTDNRRFGVKEFRINTLTKQATFVICLLPGEETPIGSARPPEALFDIRPQDEKTYTPRSTTWKPAIGLPIPAWTVTVSNWPQFSPAEINAFWKHEPTIGRGLKPKNLPVKFPLSDVDNSERHLELIRFEVDRSSKKVIVHWQLRPQPTGPLTADYYLSLIGTRIGISSKSEVPEYEHDFIGVSREVVEGDGLVKMIYTLRQVPEDDLELHVTSWKKWLDGASKPKQSLRIKPQN